MLKMRETKVFIRRKIYEIYKIIYKVTYIGNSQINEKYPNILIAMKSEIKVLMYTINYNE